MATYYVDSAATGANNGTSEADAWTTIDTAMNNVIAGDKVWVKASGNYNETATIDTAGSSGSEIIFEGYTSIPGDNGKVTIDGQSTRANCVIEGAVTASYYIFKNFIFTGATGRGVQIAGGDQHTYMNCEFTNNGGEGILGDNSFRFINCKFVINGGRGVQSGSSVVAIGCIFGSNTNDNVDSDSCTLLYKNVCYGVSDFNQGFDVNGCFAAVGNTLDGEGSASSTGLLLSTDTDPIIIDNIIYDFNIAVNVTNSPVFGGGYLTGYNLLNSNNTDYQETGETVGYQDVTTAPGFTDEAGDDYRLSENSPARNKGLVPGGIT